MARKATAKPKPIVVVVATRRRFPFRAAIAATVCVAVVGGVVALGLSAAAMIDHRERFCLPLSAIDFELPPWVEREGFLAEVRYLDDLPEKFNSYDGAATDRVRRAFAKHPWVETVGDGNTTVARRYSLTVVFRKPVLRVSAANGETRTVDAKGVLLPPVKTVDDLPVLSGPAALPMGAAGTVWNDPTVKRAAELAGQYNPKSIAKAEAGWRITERNGRVLVVGW